MKKITMLWMALAITILISVNVQSAFAWCTPRILHCGDVIDSTTAQGHNDISRYNPCAGTINWNGYAHVYKINHPGDSLNIRLEWTGTDTIGVFLLSDCNAGHCFAFGYHQINIKRNAGEIWIIVDARRTRTTRYTLRIYCGDHRLPVELLGFDGRDAQDGVHLSWSTASETDNNGFRVERQRENTEDWQQVGYVNSHGQSATRSDYTFVDANVQTGQRYAYRLTSIANTGETDELQLIVVTHGEYNAAEAPREFRLLGNYPNPFNPTTRVVFELNQQADITLKVYNPVGQLVGLLASGTYEAGAHSVEFNAADLPTGMYIAQLSNGSQTQMMKMMLIK
jgi:hypothetical protein